MGLTAKPARAGSVCPADQEQGHPTFPEGQLSIDSPIVRSIGLLILFPAGSPVCLETGVL